MQSPIPQPNPPTPVVDYAGVLDASTKQRLEALLKNLSENPKANVEMGVVTVKTTGGQDIFDYSLAVMRGWGIGDERTQKGGLLFLIAVDDRKAYLQVSRHVEGEIPDSVAGDVQRRYLVPALREGDYNKGVWDTVQAYIAILAEKRGFQIAGMDQRYGPRPSGQPSGGNPRRGTSGCSMFFIILIIVVFLLIAGRGRGGGGSGCLQMLLLGSILNSGRGSSGWSSGGWGGGSGWGGGGGGGDWGGFSGGGGDAGGGGAGSSW